MDIIHGIIWDFVTDPQNTSSINPLPSKRLLGGTVDSDIHVRNEKKPGCLGYIGDYTTQLNRDYK